MNILHVIENIFYRQRRREGMNILHAHPIHRSNREPILWSTNSEMMMMSCERHVDLRRREGIYISSLAV
jgi:hypothetical protein